MTVNPYSKVTAESYGWFKTFYQNVVVFFLHFYVRSKCRLRVEGKENIPDGTGFIVASNHLSNLDPPLISVSMFGKHNVAYMAKEELYSNWFTSWFFKNVGTFSVNRKKMEISTIKSAKEVVKSKWVLGMFPEGTRNQEGGGMKELKKGVAFISKTANAPVLPVGLSHDKEDPWVIIVRFGKLIPVQSTIEEMSEALQNALCELTGQSPETEGESEPSNVISLAEARKDSPETED